jgi:hypothetical protein
MHGGPQGCETSRLSHFLDNRLTDDGEVISLTRQPSCIRRKIPSTHFCWRLSRHQGDNAAGRIRRTEKPSDLIWSRARDLPACSIVPQPTTLLRVPRINELRQMKMWYTLNSAETSDTGEEIRSKD